MGGALIAFRGKPEPVEVKIEAAKERDIRLVVTGSETGTVKAETEVLVIPRVSGRLDKLLVKEGQFVRAGQLLGVLDDADISAQVQQMEASLNSQRAREESARHQLQAQPELIASAIARAEAGVKEAEANLAIVRRGARAEEIAAEEARLAQLKAAAENARREFVRQRELYDKGYISRSQLDGAESSMRVSEEQVAAQTETLRLRRTQSTPEDIKEAEGRLAQAKAALQEAKANSVEQKLRRTELAAAQAQVQEVAASLRQMRTQQSYRRIVAPVSGQVTRMNVKEGEFVVGGTSFGLQAQQLSMMTIINDAALYVEALVSESDIARLAIGQSVEVSCDAYRERKFHGTLVEISPAANAEAQSQQRTFKVKVKLADAKGYLRPGMSAEIEVLTGIKRKVLSIPTYAIKEENKKKKVLVVKGQSCEEREVTVGEKNFQFAEIKRGLKSGDRIISTIDVPGLSPGKPIKEKK